MAEGAVGLAISIVGLASLFNNVIDCFEYIHIGKNFGGDFETSLLRLDNAMLRLSRWGEAVGLCGRITEETTLPSWIKPEEKTSAEKTLGKILNLFEDAEKEAAKFKDGKNEKDASLAEYNDDDNKDLNGAQKTYHQIMRDISVRRHNRTKLRTKFKFAVYSHIHLKEMIEKITSLTNDLVTLFPERPELGKKEQDLCSNEVKELTNSLKDLAEKIKDNDTALAAALNEVLKPAV
jgi:tRNA U34 5-carboxymethylaminomethyl modifying enzyme MnmG/GidA